MPDKKSKQHAPKSSKPQTDSAKAKTPDSTLEGRDKAKSLAPKALARFDHKSFLAQLTTRPGVYQMYDEAGEILYVGKAKNLKNRVSSYFAARGLNSKTVALVARIARIDVTVTSTEAEALILEQNLIKSHRPPFNILLRDDKSYPYVLLSAGKFPRLSYHRGAKRAKGQYFGPYPSAGAVRESLSLLQRVFQVRQCEESYFKNRSRPCLQYQIKRCTAPCVNLVSEEDYSEQVNNTRLFLEGKSQELIRDLGDKMQEASKNLAFEEAAELRDQIQHLQKVTESQFIESDSEANADVVAAEVMAGQGCVHILFIRGGRILGSKSYYPKITLEQNSQDLLNAFLAQYYLAQSGHAVGEMPNRIFVSSHNQDSQAIQDALIVQNSSALNNSANSRKIRIQAAKQGAPVRWLQLASDTASENLKNRLADKQSIAERFEDLQQQFDLDEVPSRLECFDISHSSGEATVASCVVFDASGPLKSDYRRFNIDGITKGDDYAAMQQALERRFKRLAKGEGKRPDILLIDGGKGQVSQAKAVLAELQLNDILIIGVAKGPSRKAGLEQLILANENRVIQLPNDAKALHLIQHVRDESHRFAVKSHTQRRDKKRSRSQLDDVPGVGPKRRKDLLQHFGSVQAIKEAPVRELIKVQGISEKVAEDIYACFHRD